MSDNIVINVKSPPPRRQAPAKPKPSKAAKHLFWALAAVTAYIGVYHMTHPVHPLPKPPPPAHVAPEPIP